MSSLVKSKVRLVCNSGTSKKSLLDIEGVLPSAGWSDWEVGGQDKQ